LGIDIAIGKTVAVGHSLAVRCTDEQEPLAVKACLSDLRSIRISIAKKSTQDRCDVATLSGDE
jgi:hypothetical protein